MPGQVSKALLRIQDLQDPPPRYRIKSIPDVALDDNKGRVGF